MTERRGERAGSLSGGQQKIVEIARATMVQPRLMLMDEPSMGLDPKARHLVFETVTRLNARARRSCSSSRTPVPACGSPIAAWSWTSAASRWRAPPHELLEDPKVAALYLGGHVDGATAAAPAVNGSARRAASPPA